MGLFGFSGIATQAKAQPQKVSDATEYMRRQATQAGLENTMKTNEQITIVINANGHHSSKVVLK